MGTKLTDKHIRCLEEPLKGGKVYYCSLINRLDICVAANGAKLVVLDYIICGRECRITIGRYLHGQFLRPKNSLNCTGFIRQIRHEAYP